MKYIQIPLFFDKNELYYSIRLKTAWISHSFYTRNPHHWAYWKQYKQVEFTEEDVMKMKGYSRENTK